MSEIRVTTVSDTAGTGPVTLTKQHATKSWCHWSDASVIRDSFNVSSITDMSTGSNKIGYTNNMANGNYSGGGMTRTIASGGTAFMRLSGTMTTSETRYFCVTDDGTATDGETQTVVVNGDLA